MGRAARIYRGNPPPPARPRESAARRGYDRRWAAFRKRYLILNPHCLDCAEQGRRTLAREIHHITKLSEEPGRKYDADNLRPLCRTCHQIRTVRGE